MGEIRVASLFPPDGSPRAIEQAQMKNPAPFPAAGLIL